MEEGRQGGVNRKADDGDEGDALTVLAASPTVVDTMTNPPSIISSGMERIKDELGRDSSGSTIDHSNGSTLL